MPARHELRYDADIPNNLFRHSWLIPLVLLLGVMLFALNAQYPLLGNDFEPNIGNLLAGRFHFLRQGPLPFRFSPHFCGGMPVYGHPQEMFYSLPQLLTLVLPPWTAIQLAILALMVLGYAGWVRFGNDVLSLTNQWAHLLALTISANGFFLLHMAAGHLPFSTAPLLGWLLWFLLHPGEESVQSMMIQASLFALLGTFILLSGGYIVILFMILGLLIGAPISIILRGETRQRHFMALMKRWCVYGAMFFALSLSKLVAVYSFMRFFPRTTSFDRISDGASATGFLLRSLFMIPQSSSFYAHLKLSLSIHELSTWTSPIIIAGMILLIFEGIHRRVLRTYPIRTVLVMIHVFFISVFFTQLIAGKGVVAAFLENLPILSSVHAVIRFLYPYSLAVTMFGILGLALFARRIPRFHARESSIATGLSLLTVILLLVAHGSLFRNKDAIGYAVRYNRIQELLKTHRAFRDPVKTVRAGGTFPFHVLQGTTGIQCYEPIFGYRGERQITALVKGTVYKVWDGAFNLLNPACFQYPQENNCKPGDRIKVTDRENFERFRFGKRTSWRLSAMQRIADFVSLATLLYCISSVLGKFRHPRTVPARKS